MKHQQVDWSQPQRQPLEGLLIAFFNVLWEIAKRSWWVLLYILFKNNTEETSRVSRLEYIAIALAVLTFSGTLIRYLFFRFYIANDELIIKKGWIKKQTLVVPLQKIQTVHIEASPLHRLLNVVKLSADTAGSDKTEIQIDALSRPMAEALQNQLENSASGEEILPDRAEAKLLTRLSGSDLLKLSLSANHLETFALLLSFGIGLYENIKDLDGSLLPDASGFGFTGMVILFLAVSVLITTIFISTLRIFLKFYGMTVYENCAGMSIRSGLTNVKERVVAIRKVQVISWKANWIRKRLGLWLVEYRIAGESELKKAQRVQVPVTKPLALPVLVNPYHAVPEVNDAQSLSIHSSYVMRRLLLAGIIPAIFLIAVTVYWWGAKSLVFLIIPLLVGIAAALHQRRFRLWAFEDVVFIDKSTWGMEKVLLQWYKVQSVRLKQSYFQRKKGLATVTLYTAGGSIVVPFIPLESARILVNYALYKVESSAKKWM
jgi:putative membrane protein